MKKIILAALVLLASIVTARADITWTNTTGGYWTNAANWDAGTYPGQYGTNAAVITNNVTVILDSEPDYYVPILTLGAHLLVTNTIDTGTTTFYMTNNSRLTIAANSRWKSPASGIRYFQGTNVVVDVQSNAVWEAYVFYIGHNTTAGDFRIGGSGDILMRSGGTSVGYSNALPTGYNTVIIDGLDMVRTHFYVAGSSLVGGGGSLGNTVIYTNTHQVGALGGSSRVGSASPCSSNTVILTGSNTVIDTQGGYFYTANATFTTGCVLRIENGATLTNSYPIYFQMTVPTAADSSFNSIIITNGGRAVGGGWAVGNYARSHSNTVHISGADSKLDLTGFQTFSVGTAGSTGNVLRISDGATVEGLLGLTVNLNNALELANGTLSTHEFTYNPTTPFVIGDGCTMINEYGPTPSYEGIWTVAGGILVDTNGTLRGRGIIRGGEVVVTNGGVIQGSRFGTLNLTNTTLAGGATVRCAVKDLRARPGGGWSFLNVGTQLTFTAASPNYLFKLTSEGATVQNFDPEANYVLKVAEAKTLVGYDPTKITVNTNSLILGGVPLAPWVVTNFDGKIFVTYTATNEVFDNGGYAWQPTSNGLWSTAVNWTNSTAPTSGVGMVLAFGGDPGSGRYFSTNDVADPFDLHTLVLTSQSIGTNVLSGGKLRFNGEDAVLYKDSGGSFIISNLVDTVSNLTCSGSAALEGNVILATNLVVNGGLYKTGKWTLVFQGSNTITGDVIVDSGGGGGITLASAARLSAANVYVTNGVISRTTTTPHTFGNAATLRNYLLTGPGSLYQLAGAYTIGSNAIVTVTNQAQMRIAGGLTVNSAGSVSDPLHICGGGEVYSTGISTIGATNSDNRITVHDAGKWDLGQARLYVGNGTGSSNVLVITDEGSVDWPAEVWVGGVSGQQGGNYNGIAVTNGTLQTYLQSGANGPWRIGAGTNVVGNFMVVGPGGLVTTRGGSGNNYAYPTIGYGPGAVSNWVRVDAGRISHIEPNNRSGIHIGGGNGTAAGAPNTHNHLDIVNGGYVQCNRAGATGSHLDVAGANGASYNYAYVAGVGSTYDLEAQLVIIGGWRNCTGNYVRVENGGALTEVDGIRAGATSQSTGTPLATNCSLNYLSVSNATVESGVLGSAAVVGGSYGCNSNYIEMLEGAYWSHYGPIYIGGGVEAAASNNVGNYVLLSGCEVENVGNIRLGLGTGSPKSASNYMILTNGATLHSLGVVYIGYATGCNSNWISVVNANWDMASSSLNIGLDATCIGNRLYVGSAGTLTRVENLTVNTNNILELAGGYLATKAVSVSGSMEGQGTLTGTTTFTPSATLKPTTAFGLSNVVLPTNMTVNAASLTGTVLINYSGSASGATDLSGWTVTNGPAGYMVKLDTGLKQVKLAPPNKNLRISNGKAHVVGGRLLLSQ